MKNLKRLVSVMMAVVMIFGILPQLSVSAAYENTHINTGNQAYDIVEVAKTQIGYTEGSNNDTKYNRWYGRLSGFPSDGYGYAWCQTFVAWCANQAGISTSDIPKVSGTISAKQTFINNGTYHKGPYEGGSYTPKKGDIIYFYSSATDSKHHVGIVSDCVGGIVYTIEGNSSNKVQTCSYSVTNSKIRGYGVPNYSGTVVESLATPTISTDKDSYTVGDIVNLSWAASPSSSNLSHYWLIINAPDGTTILNETMNLNTSYSFTVTQEGNYTVTSFATPQGSPDGSGSLTDVATIAVNPNVWYRDMTPVDLGSSFYAYIINTSAWKHVTNDNTNVSLRTETGDLNQIWEFSRNEDGSYKIKNCADGLILDVNNFGTTNGTNVQVWVNNDSSAQRFYIYGVSGAYYLRGKCGDLVLDVNGGLIEDGTNIQMWEKNDSTAQQFQIWKLQTELSVTAGTKTTKTIFNWRADNSSFEAFDVKIWNGAYWVGDAYHIEWDIIGDSFEINLPPGYYEAYVDGRFEGNVVMSNVVTFTVEEDYNPADINQDSQTTVLDIVLLQKYLLDLHSFTPVQFTTADINSDGAVDGFDLALLKRMLLER